MPYPQQKLISKVRDHPPMQLIGGSGLSQAKFMALRKLRPSAHQGQSDELVRPLLTAHGLRCTGAADGHVDGTRRGGANPWASHRGPDPSPTRRPTPRCRSGHGLPDGGPHSSNSVPCTPSPSTSAGRPAGWPPSRTTTQCARGVHAVCHDDRGAGRAVKHRTERRQPGQPLRPVRGGRVDPALPVRRLSARLPRVVSHAFTTRPSSCRAAARARTRHAPNHTRPSGTIRRTESTARVIATAPTRLRVGVERPSPVPDSAGENAAPIHRST